MNLLNQRPDLIRYRKDETVYLHREDLIAAIEEFKPSVEELIKYIQNVESLRPLKDATT